MTKNFKYAVYIVSIGFFHSLGNGAVLQAMLDLDDSSEDLIGLLIEKVDKIIDPLNSDTKNATHELAAALLKIGPMITVTGNISDGNNGSFSISFSLNAKAAHQNLIATYNNQGLGEIKHGSGGFFEPLVSLLEPYILTILQIIAQSVLGVIISQILQATAIIDEDVVI